MELPFSWARHLSIPAPQWSARRRALAAVCPLFGGLVTKRPSTNLKHVLAIPLGPLESLILTEEAHERRRSSRTQKRLTNTEEAHAHRRGSRTQ